MVSIGWRALLSVGWVSGPRDWHTNTDGFSGYGIDNGAFSAWAHGKQWDESAFVDLVEKKGANADWIVVPDIVAGGLASLDFSLRWIERLRGSVLLLLAVQDGMVPEDVRDLIGPDLGLFVGGSTKRLASNPRVDDPDSWKLRTLPMWGTLAREKNAYLHVGRVNSMKRIRLCATSGAHSFDGSSSVQWPSTLARLERARSQGDLFGSVDWA